MIEYNKDEHRYILKLADDDEDLRFGQYVVKIHDYVKRYGRYDCAYHILNGLSDYVVDDNWTEYYDSTITIEKFWSYLKISGTHIIEDGPDEWSMTKCQFVYGGIDFNGLDIICIEPNKVYRVGEWLEIII